MSADTFTLCAGCGAEQRTDVAVLCTACTSRLAGRLRGVRDLLGYLRDSTARLSRVERRPGRPTPHPEDVDEHGRPLPLTAAARPLPLDLEASSAADDVRSAVTRWTLTLLGELEPPDLPPCRHASCEDPWRIGPPCVVEDAHAERLAHIVRVRTGLEDGARWLADRVALVRHRPWAARAALEVGVAVRDGWALVDQPEQRWFAGSCDTTVLDVGDVPARCGWELYARVQDSVITCRGCGTRIDVVARRDLLIAAAGDMLVTATQAATALTSLRHPLAPATVRSWKFRGRLEAVDVNERGQPLYRLGDVREVQRRELYGIADPPRSA